MAKIEVAEQFYSIQGEGPNAGAPAVFLRLAGCNLCCGGRKNQDRDPEDFEPEGHATWVCDTIDVWREPEATYQPDDLVEEWEYRGWLSAYRDGAHLVLTGGEPTLPKHQEAFMELMNSMDPITRPFVEVETNGTIKPEGEFIADVDLFNISLKLTNSGMPREERINEEALAVYKTIHRDISDTFAKFKFVVSGQPDVVEIQDLIDEFGIPDGMISVMPAGQTQEQLRETYPRVAEIAKENGWTFSPRLHVDAWDQATGV